MFHRYLFLSAWLCLSFPALAADLVNTRSTWKFLRGTSEASQPNNASWRAIGFNDSAFANASAPFWYGDTQTGGTQLTDMRNNYRCIFLRQTFTVTAPGDISVLHLGAFCDDGYIAWINGVEVFRYNVPAGAPTINTFASGPISEPAPFDVNVLSSPVPSSYLVNGENVLAVQVFNATLGSSDLGFDMSLVSLVDDVAPIVVDISPPASGTVNQLRQIDVVFSENVTGVNASDLRVNNAPATNFISFSPRDFRFEFPQPATGTVQVAWAFAHGIKDLSPRENAFAGGNWTYRLDPNAIPSGLNISEFMASNDKTTNDVDSASSDWIEIHNPGTVVANLNGWFLTDDPANLTKWRFPSVNLGPNSYMLVWASEKDRTNPLDPLHANFRLDGEGEFLALVDANTNVVSSFAPTYPAQQTDVSYGRVDGVPDVVGYFVAPTPGRRNSTAGAGFAPEVNFSLAGGVYTSTISLTLSAGPGTTIRYTINGTEPTTSSTLYSSPISVANSTVVKARAYQSGLLPGPSIPQTYTILATDMMNFSSPLAILVIDAFGLSTINDNSGSKKPVSMTFIERSSASGRSHILGPVDAQVRAGIEVRGSSSANFPKKSYSVETWDGSNNDLAVSLLGMPKESDWVLYAPYTDKTFMNNYLTYELHEAMGHYAVRRRFVEVFLDRSGGTLSYASDYVGIYVLLEKIKIDKERVDIAKLSPSDTAEPNITGGYLIKKDRLQDADDVPFTVNGGSGFASQTLGIEDPKKGAVTQVQIDWIRDYMNQFAAALGSSTFADTRAYTNYIDVDSFVDQHWIVEFAKNIDGYRLSNFMHKDRGGKLKMDPVWDWNLSFGNADYLQGEATNTWYYTQVGDGEYPWFRRLFQDPDFNQRYIDRWGDLRTTVFHPTNVQARITRIAAEINEATARDYQKWPRMGNYVWPNPPGIVPITTFSGMVDWIKRWSNGRYYWIDSQFVKPPVFSHAGGPISPGLSLTITAPSTIYYTLDGSDPRLSGGAISPSARSYTGPIVISANARVVARTRSGTSWSGPTSATFVTATPTLRITEIMFNPADAPAGNTNDSDNFEFIEVKNVGAAPLNVNGFRLTRGVEFTFPNATLEAGQSAVIVRHQAAFVSRYGAGLTILGIYDGQLDNGGERLTLEGAVQEPILDFSYDDDWYPVTDGMGFSLVIVNANAPASDWGMKSSWRPSSDVNGSPAANDPAAPIFAPVVINEALTHTDLPQVDAIELHNPGTATANIGGWFLTDDFDAPKKFRIPDSTTIAAGGFLVFTETDFNAAGGSNIPFSLSSQGDDLFLFSGDASSNLTGFFHGFDFGAQENGRTFGRHVISTGADRFVVQSANSLGSANVGPLVGPIVISEVMYHPPDNTVLGYVLDNTEDEFIELQNISGAPVGLFDAAHPTNTWRLRDAVKFDFPPKVSVAAGARILVVGFDPANASQLSAFRSRNGVAGNVPVYGPFNGKLDNSQDSVELVRPDSPEMVPAPNAGFVPSILVDKVNYADNFPWPVGADGFGPSLQRVVLSSYGNDPANWVAALKTPGAAYPGGSLPIITQQPASKSAVATSTVTFSVGVSGTGPFTYQWRYHGANIPQATSSTLVLPNVQIPQSGEYQVLVFNSAGVASSSIATLTVGFGANITQHPISLAVRGSTNAATYGMTFSNVVFSTSAVGTPPLRYQWRLNGDDIGGATSDTLVIPNASLADEGIYDVVLTDASGTLVSDPASLTVEIPVFFVQTPANITIAEGGDVALSAEVRGNPAPYTFSWRRIFPPEIFTVITGNSSSNFLILNSTANGLVLAQNELSKVIACRLVISNSVSTGQGIATSFNVTLLADRDEDGLADAWELENGLDPASALDGELDGDGDGMSNRDEFIAGTQPTNALSYLRIDQQLNDSSATVQFHALSNKTYTIEYTDRLGGAWSGLADFFAYATNRVETMTDYEWSTNRYYRVTTPQR